MKLFLPVLLTVFSAVTDAQSSTKLAVQSDLRGSTLRTVTPLTLTSRKVAILKRDANFQEAEDSTEAANESDVAGEGEAAEGGESVGGAGEATEAAINEEAGSVAASSGGVGLTDSGATSATNASEASGEEKTDNAQDAASTEGSVSSMVLSVSMIVAATLLI